MDVCSKDLSFKELPGRDVKRLDRPEESASRHHLCSRGRVGINLLDEENLFGRAGGGGVALRVNKLSDVVSLLPEHGRRPARAHNTYSIVIHQYVVSILIVIVKPAKKNDVNIKFYSSVFHLLQHWSLLWGAFARLWYPAHLLDFIFTYLERSNWWTSTVKCMPSFGILSYDLPVLSSSSSSGSSSCCFLDLSASTDDFKLAWV